MVMGCMQEKRVEGINLVEIPVTLGIKSGSELCRRDDSRNKLDETSKLEESKSSMSVKELDRNDE